MRGDVRGHHGAFGSIVRRCIDALMAPASVAPVDRVRRLLGLWTAVYIGLRLPHVEELYCRSVLNDAPIRRLVDIGVPPPELMQALMVVLIVVAVLGPGWRYVRAASCVIGGLFAIVIAFESSPPRAYAALALIQWLLLACASPRCTEGAEIQVTGWGWRLLRLQYTSVYFFAGLSKLCSSMWWSGAAIVYVLRSSDYGGVVLSSSAEIPAHFALFFGWATVLGELFIALGLWWSRSRRWAICAVVALHLSMILTIRISLLFHSLMLLHLVLFIDSRRSLLPARR